MDYDQPEDVFARYYLGKVVYIRTVTYARVGKIIAIDQDSVYLHPAIDIVETGDFKEFFTGKIKAHEPVRTTHSTPAMISRLAIVDATGYFAPMPEEHDWSE